MMSDYDLAYLAGLFDGEGHAAVGTYVKRGYVCKIPILQVRMTDERPVRELEIFLGGCVFLANKTKSGKQVYQWSAGHRQALHAAQLLFPHLRNQSKVDQVRKVLMHYASTT